MIKGICLRNTWKTSTKAKGSVNHHLNTTGLDKSSSRPPLPPVTPLSLRRKRAFYFYVLHLCKHVTGARRHCAHFSERLDSVCLQSVHASVHAFVICPYKDMNFSWVDFHLLGFCTMLCADDHQPFTGFIIFFAHSEKFPPFKQCDRSVIIIIIIIIIIGSTALGGPRPPRDRSVQGRCYWLPCISVRLDSVGFGSHSRSLSKRDYEYTKIQQQVAREICKEICSEANTAHAFELTAALSELQDYVPGTVRSWFHKFNHSTPCATNAALPPSPTNDGFRIIYWIAPAIWKTFCLMRIYGVKRYQPNYISKTYRISLGKKGVFEGKVGAYLSYEYTFWLLQYKHIACVLFNTFVSNWRKCDNTWRGNFLFNQSTGSTL